MSLKRQQIQKKREGKAKDKGLVLFESGHDKRHKQTQSSDKEEGEITDTD